MANDVRLGDDAPDAAADPPHWLRNVILFLSGQTVSLFGSMLVQYTVFWYLTITYQSGFIMTLAALFGFLPQAVVSIFGGVWADRHNRKFLIMGADAAIALTTLGLALIMMSGYDELWVIFAAMAVRSAGAGIQSPAVSALIPQIVPTRNLMRINGVNGSIQSAMALLAPA
ncbi:MAG: MFS transporter, partial [Microbacteriaceae bacterium]